MDGMQTTDKLLSDGTAKLQSAISSGSKVDSQGADVACKIKPSEDKEKA